MLTAKHTRIGGLAVLLAAAAVAQQQQPPPRDREVPISLSALLDGDGFVRIAPGEFTMGAEGGRLGEQPVHRVRITTAFEMSKYEVTQAQWVAAMAPAHPKSGEPRDPKEWNPSRYVDVAAPVESVSWVDVQGFLEALNARDPKHVYRLPTEAEWEYACVAGGSGNAATNLKDSAWHEANAGDKTHPAGQKKPNAWGLYDMQGNVSEWVQDFFSTDYYDTSPAADPAGPAAGSYKVYRGGNWFSKAEYCRCSSRAFDFPSNGTHGVGFRIVRTPK